MKKIFFLAILAISVFAAQAQGNLQFNQVKVITGVLGNYSTSQNYVVPENKVWKIEFFTSPAGIIINDQPSNTGYDFSGYSGQCPIWLGQGDRVKAACWTVTGGSAGFALSIIEFNVIP